MHDTRIANLFLVARRAGVSIDDALPHFDAMLQPVIFLSQAAGLPLHYRFRPSPDGPVSQDLRRDLAQYREHPDHYVAITNGRDLFAGYSRYIDQVNRLKSMTPKASEVLDWMRTAAIIHHTSDTLKVNYPQAAFNTSLQYPDLAHLTEPDRKAMADCGFMPRWERPLFPS